MDCCSTDLTPTKRMSAAHSSKNRVRNIAIGFYAAALSKRIDKLAGNQ
jgi:hypothetical protein